MRAVTCQVHFVCRPLIGLLYQTRMIYDDECGAVGVMIIDRRKRSTRRKPAPMPLRPQIPYDLLWARTRTAALGCRRLRPQPHERTKCVRCNALCDNWQLWYTWKHVLKGDSLVSNYYENSCLLSYGRCPMWSRMEATLYILLLDATWTVRTSYDRCHCVCVASLIRLTTKLRQWPITCLVV
jgi:hypothetical protein